jgi:flagellar hook-associated protein 2
MASISGLSSGLDTATIIKQLMQLERIPQARLQSKQTAMESSIGSLRTLNTKFASLLGAAEKLGARLPGAVVPSPPPPSEWQATKATSSDATRTSATATAGAPAGSLSFNVQQLATAASHLSATYNGTAAVMHTDANGDASTSFTLSRAGNGSSPVTITTANGTLTETADAVNAAKAGVTASVVQMTAATDTTPATYALQLTSTTTGKDSGIALTAADGTDLVSKAVVTGKDAVIDLGGGTLVQRSSNTMSDVLQGVTLTLAKADTKNANGAYEQPAVTVDVKKDMDGIAAKVQALVDAANSARNDAKSLTAVDPVTKAKGRLYGESSVRGLVDRVRSVFSEGTTELSQAGITVDRHGVASFDKTKFLEALAADPSAVEAAVGNDGLAGRLHGLADQVSRPASAVGGAGLITGTITSKEGQISSLKSNIESWDNRLAMKERMLERQYTALETAMGKAQSQGAWLSSQLANLPSWSNS